MHLKIKSAQGEYEVSFSKSLAELAKKLSDIPFAKVVIDEKVEGLYKKSLNALLDPLDVYLLPANEKEKTLAGVQKLCTWLQEVKANKKTHLIVIGGGITQDIATLVAAIFYRGIQWTLVPTTLLSMADSCLGAKCAVNLNEYKNQLGLFWSPSAIHICADFVSTLEVADIESGHGEIYKLSMVHNNLQRKAYQEDIAKCGFQTPRLLEHIFTSLKNKKAIIEEDEFDTGPRRCLNFGHTFGHALEAVTDNQIPHGQAVAFGMDLINFYAMRKGFLQEATFMEIHKFIADHFHLSTEFQVSAEALISYARKDKKIVGDKALLAVYTDNHCLELKEEQIGSELKTIITEYLSTYGHKLLHS